MSQPVCDYCRDEIGPEETFVQIGGGTVHRDEPQNDAGGGMFHPGCGVKYIKENYMEM